MCACRSPKWINASIRDKEQKIIDYSHHRARELSNILTSRGSSSRQPFHSALWHSEDDTVSEMFLSDCSVFEYQLIRRCSSCGFLSVLAIFLEFCLPPNGDGKCFGRNRKFASQKRACPPAKMEVSFRLVAYNIEFSMRVIKYELLTQFLPSWHQYQHCESSPRLSVRKAWDLLCILPCWLELWVVSQPNAESKRRSRWKCSSPL